MLLLRKKKKLNLIVKYATGLEKISLIIAFFFSSVQPGRQHIKKSQHWGGSLMVELHQPGFLAYLV